MKLTNTIEVRDFLEAIAQAKDAVYLKSIQGDCYNLKSTLSRYVALGALISDHGEELELFCDDPSDEPLFFNFFAKHPNVL